MQKACNVHKLYENYTPLAQCNLFLNSVLHRCTKRVAETQAGSFLLASPPETIV